MAGESQAQSRSLPTGAVTFLLTDIEGSTRFWDEHPSEMATALARHDELVAGAVTGHEGRLLKTRGEGDSTFSVFDRPAAAVAAALDLQRAVSAEQWPVPVPIRVRAAVHTGEAELRDGDYFGGAVNRAARLRAIGHGGQVLVSEAIAHLANDSLPHGASLHDLGIHRLRDLARAEHVYELRHSDLPSGFPPLLSLDARSHNLPVELTSFVGRERELNELVKLLGEHRLVTLTGAGGSGKTRLAQHTAAALVDSVADGVWLVELSPLSDGSLVAGAVASVLSVREQPGRDVLDVLADEIRAREMLLVLDNCEHLVDACAHVVERLLLVAPGLRVLATSREPLDVAGELTYVVQPLGMPPPDASVGADDLHEYDALHLFTERAALTRPDFAAEPSAIARVCRQLDGIPLAIELAAARVNVLTVDQLSARLDDRFRILTGGPRTAERRQQTLRGAIDWSYDLLSPVERDLFARLSVFAGSATLAAIEAVCGDCLEALSQLVDKSLVVVEGDRYRMLDSIRAYAAEKLAESGARDEAIDALVGWAFGLLARHRDELIVLDAEVDNIRAALNVAPPDSFSRDVLLNLSAFWFGRGHWREAADWFERLERADHVPATLRALCATQAADFLVVRGESERAMEAATRALDWAVDDEDRIRALDTAAKVFHARGDATRAMELWEQAADLARSSDSPMLSTVLGNLGVGAHSRSEHERARAYFEEALAAGAAGRTGDAILLNLGNVLNDLGDYDGAATALERGLAGARARGNLRNTAYGLRKLAQVAVARGQPAEAMRQLEECLEIFREMEDVQSASATMIELADMKRREGDSARALDLAYAALEVVRPIGNARMIAARRLGIVLNAAAAGAETEIDAHLPEVLVMARASEWPSFRSYATFVAGVCALDRGHSEAAATLLAAYEPQVSATQMQLAPQERREIEEVVARVRRQLSTVDFEAAWSRGREMSADEAIELAISIFS